MSHIHSQQLLHSLLPLNLMLHFTHICYFTFSLSSCWNRHKIDTVQGPFDQTVDPNLHMLAGGSVSVSTFLSDPGKPGVR